MVNNYKETAIIIPCFNEEKTIAATIDEFSSSFPQATIYVYDNNSTDLTASIAEQRDIIVKKEKRQGKGYVLRKAFKEINADYYIIIDGDYTYPARFAMGMLKLVIDNKADMVVGSRLKSHDKNAFRRFHEFGNYIITETINKLFNSSMTDVLSGYRVLNKSFVKNVPLISKGFEIESEMTINGLDMEMTIEEVSITYRERPEDSYSKLNTFRDGFLILSTILLIFKDYRPLLFFSITAVLSGITGLLIGMPVLYEFFTTGTIEKIPSAILASAFELLSFQLIGVGLMLDTMARNRRLDNNTRQKQ